MSLETHSHLFGIFICIHCLPRNFYSVAYKTQKETSIHKYPSTNLYIYNFQIYTKTLISVKAKTKIKKYSKRLHELSRTDLRKLISQSRSWCSNLIFIYLLFVEIWVVWWIILQTKCCRNQTSVYTRMKKRQISAFNQFFLIYTPTPQSNFPFQSICRVLFIFVLSLY